MVHMILSYPPARARPTNVKKGAERSDGRSGYSCQNPVALCRNVGRANQILAT